MDTIPDTKERLERLSEMVRDFRSYCFGEMYGIADFTERNPEMQKEQEKLSSEASLYTEFQERIQQKMEELGMKSKCNISGVVCKRSEEPF